MTRMLAALLVGAMVVWCPDSADPQDLGDLFRKVNSSVVVIRARGRDVGETGLLSGFTEIGSGVLISADGKVMTAADLSLLQLERVPAGAKVATLGDSGRVGVGEPVLIVGPVRAEPRHERGMDQRPLAPK
jgi:S1-C subfamily serine protease